MIDMMHDWHTLLLPLDRNIMDCVHLHMFLAVVTLVLFCILFALCVHGFFSSLGTSNGIQSPEKEQLKASPASESPNAPVQGEYNDTAADGQKHLVSYVADDDGYASSNDYQSTHYSPKRLLKSFVIDNYVR